MKILCLALLVMLEPTARADTPPPAAETFYAEGQAAYKSGDYATAIAKWLVSYELSGESDLLFDLAQAYRLSGDCRNAITTYKRFIENDPLADQRPLADDLVHELEQTCVPRPTTSPPRTNFQPRLGSELNLALRRNSPKNLLVAGLVTGGAGIALLAGGLLLGHHASTLSNEVTSACAISCDWTAWRATDQVGRRDTTLGYVFDGVGLVAILGGAALYYFGSRESSIVVSPKPHDGAAVTWVGSW